MSPTEQLSNSAPTSFTARWRALLTDNAFSAVIVSFVYFFCLLTSYSMLRPVREEMGVQSGVGNLPWLFTGTFVAMLLLTPIYGWMASKLTRLGVLRGVYVFFIANMLLFMMLMKAGSTTTVTAISFYIWFSVFNLFVVSVFWTVMTDVFTREQGERLFGWIAAGGTVGAITGPAITTIFVKTIGVANLLLLSAFFLLVPLFAISWLMRWAAQHRHDAIVIAQHHVIGGNPLDGIIQTWQSPLLRTLAVYFLLFVTLSTFLYFEQIRIVGETIKDSATRTAFFARIDLAVNTLTLLLQFGVTRWLLTRVGIFRALVILPLITLIGFIAMSFSPTLTVLAGFIIMRRAADFAIARPAREAIFTMVDVSARYKAKNFIDTTVYRGGDAASAWMIAMIKQLTGSGAALAAAALPFALAWLALVGWLARKGESLAAQHQQQEYQDSVRKI